MLLSEYVYPRWHSHDPLSPSRQGSGTLSEARQFSEPLPDLEQQLAAELDGAAWAVVAFVPEDAAWCDWIYRNINGFPLPVSLIDRVTPHGIPRPDCLSVFPDRRDPSWHDHAARALESGAYLVVLCSPHSAHAADVDEQLRAFKRSGGEERIIALVVDGPPDAHLGEHPRAAASGWLPSWLRWRLEVEGFRPADRSEPRIVDARFGYRSLKQVRDALLTALVDMDAGELERLGGFNRTVEMAQEIEAKRVIPSAITSSLIPVPLPPEATRPIDSSRNSTFMIWTAVALVVIAVFFGTRSFVEITAEEPESTLAVAPVTGILPGRTAKQKAAEAWSATLVPEPPLIKSPVAEPPSVATPIPIAQTPPVATSSVSTPPAPIPVPNIPQIAPASALAISRLKPVAFSPGSDVEFGSVTTVATGATALPMPHSNPAQDAVLLDEVRTLERRGDETMAEKRIEDALDLYSTALDSALEYAGRKGASATDKDQVVMLLRKLAVLQGQHASTAEARANFQRARKTLLQLRAKGDWTRERARALDEMEARLLSLPRD